LSFPLHLALRYLRSTRRDAFVSFLSAVATGGIALGVAALILSLAALSGFQRVLIGEVLARSPKLQVELPAGSGEEAVEAALAAARAEPGVAAARPVVHGTGWVVAADGGMVRPVDLTGFAGAVPASFPGAAGRPEGLYLDSSIAAVWGLEPGDPVEVVSPYPTLVPFGPPQPRVRSLPLAGTFERPRTQEDRARAALPLDVARSLLPGRRPMIEVDATEEAALRLAPRLAAALPAGSEVRTWRDLNRSLFFVLRLEKAMMFVAVALIVLVAALALVADLALIISSKRSEIGMLGAMGAGPAMLRRAFLVLGALLAGIGASLGTLLGVGGSWLLDRYEVIGLPGDVYVFDHVPFHVRPLDLGAVLALTVALAALFSLYAARRAAALTPVEALRR
jgi:lipoprotein-releasing system permease protein